MYCVLNASSYQFIMADCWRPLPEERPAFNELVTIIDNIATSLACYLDISSETYV